MGCFDTQSIIDCITCEQGSELPAQASCGCSCTPATPVPYYKQANSCEQSHKQIIVQNQYALGVTTVGSVVMPLCNETVTLVIPGLQLIGVGSYLWNPTFGYLKVVSFDVANQTVLVENECQEGNAAPGTTIPACTVFSGVDTPIGVNNPCDQQAVTSGALLVCSGSDSRPLASSTAGQVPVSTGTGNEVAFQTLDIPSLSCTTLSVDLSLILGNTGPYTIIVADTSIFSVGDIVKIDSRTDRFTVTHITSGIQFEATLAPAPAGYDVITAGTAVCLAPCCEQLEPRIEVLENAVHVAAASYRAVYLSGVPKVLVNPGDNETTDAAADTIITNPSTRNLAVGINLTSKVYGDFDTAGGVGYANLALEPLFDAIVETIGGGGVLALTGAVINYHTALNQVAADILQDYVLMLHYSALVPPGNQIKFNFRTKLSLISSVNVTRYTIGSMQALLEWVAGN